MKETSCVCGQEFSNGMPQCDCFGYQPEEKKDTPNIYTESPIIMGTWKTLSSAETGGEK